MAREHDRFVSLLTDAARTVLPIGVTHDVEARRRAHREGLTPGFAEHYRVNRLVYDEAFGEVLAAIAREEPRKGWTRAKKEALMARTTPNAVKGLILLQRKEPDGKRHFGSFFHLNRLGREAKATCDG